MEHKLSDWLPTTRKEMQLRGWDCADVILFSADAYVDHPSFGFPLECIMDENVRRSIIAASVQFLLSNN